MDKGKGDGHGQSFCSSFFSTFEKDLEVLLPSSLPAPSSIFYANKKKKEGREIMGREGGLFLFLLNRFNLFRFFYLDGQMLDMIKEPNKQIPPSAAYSRERQTCLAVQPNITLTSAFNAIWVGSCSRSFIYPAPLIIVVSWTTCIFMLWAVNIIHLVPPSRSIERGERKVTTTKLSSYFDINKRLKHSYMKYLIAVVRGEFIC